MTDDIDPWRDPTYYTTGVACNCIGCGNPCHKTQWGRWCFSCNVERIERITKQFQDVLSDMERKT